MDGHTTHVVVRMVHVLAATVLVGGSFGLAIAAWSSSIEQRSSSFIENAARFEIAFWAALGIIVATGIGNLGALGLGLPGPETDWGRTFSLKLVLVFVLMLVSAVRAIAVVRMRDLDLASDTAGLGRWYAVTSATAAAIVGTAVWLAHG